MIRMDKKRISKIKKRVEKRLKKKGQRGGSDYSASGSFGNTIDMTVNFITHAVTGGVLLVEAAFKAIDVGVEIYDDLARSGEPTPANPNPAP